MGTSIVLGASILGSGVLAILTDRPDRRRWHYLFKPLTTALILALLLVRPGVGPGIRLLLGIGLAASLAGDIWLMLPGDRFLPGLVSFALAHLVYIMAFGCGLASMPPLWTYLPYLALAAALVAVLWRGAAGLRLAVAIYALVIVSMAWAAGARAAQAGGAAILGWIGALFFVLSDVLLALDRFRRPVPRAGLWVLATYYLAQALIVLSA